LQRGRHQRSTFSLRAFPTALRTSDPRLWYQSMCFDHAPQPPGSPGPGHWVSAHFLSHFGHFPAVSNVFQMCPHEHIQCAPPFGSHLHFGHATLTSIFPSFPTQRMPQPISYVFPFHLETPQAYLEQVLGNPQRAGAVKRATGDRATGEVVISEGVQVHEFAGQFRRKQADPMELRTAVLEDIASLFAGEVREVEVLNDVHVRGGAAGWSPVIERYKRR